MRHKGRVFAAACLAPALLGSFVFLWLDCASFDKVARQFSSGESFMYYEADTPEFAAVCEDRGTEFCRPRQIQPCFSNNFARGAYAEFPMAMYLRGRLARGGAADFSGEIIIRLRI